MPRSEKDEHSGVSESIILIKSYNSEVRDLVKTMANKLVAEVSNM